MSLPDELSVLGHTVAHFLLKSSKILFIFSPPFSLDLLSQKSNSLDDGNNVWATFFLSLKNVHRYGSIWTKLCCNYLTHFLTFYETTKAFIPAAQYSLRVKSPITYFLNYSSWYRTLDNLFPHWSATLNTTVRKYEHISAGFSLRGLLPSTLATE